MAARLGPLFSTTTATTTSTKLTAPLSLFGIRAGIELVAALPLPSPIPKAPPVFGCSPRQMVAALGTTRCIWPETSILLSLWSSFLRLRCVISLYWSRFGPAAPNWVKSGPNLPISGTPLMQATHGLWLTTSRSKLSRFTRFQGVYPFALSFADPQHGFAVGPNFEDQSSFLAYA